ncbi:MAG: O-antigen ligase family protein [Verrucomicrobia bacterium]|nr:O-antigen ligase family protein [Verrucomicrobiota bacterium]
MSEPVSTRTSRGSFAGLGLGAGVLVVGVFAAIAWIQLRIGGTRPIFAFPGYLVLAGTGLVSLGLRRGPARANGLCLVATVAFGGYLLARTLTSPLEYLARTDLFLILAALVVYSLAALFCTAPRQRLLFLSGSLLLALGHVGVGLVQFIKDHRFLPFGYERVDDYGTRASGFYVNPNHLAGLLECVATMAIAVAVLGRINAWVRILLLYGAAVSLAGLLISGSRGGYLSIGVSGLALGCFVAYHLLRQAPKGGWVMLGAGALLLLSATIATAWFTGHSALLTQRFGAIADSGDVRLELWQAAVREFQLQPWTGTGAGTYYIYGRKFRDPSTQTDPVYVHNDYLQLLAEFGVAGAVLFAFFLCVHLWAAISFLGEMETNLTARKRTFSLSLALVAGAIFAIVALAVHSIFDFNLQIPGNTLVVAFLFGILANPGVAFARGAGQTQGWLYPATRFLPVLASLPLLILLPGRLPAAAEAEQARQALRKEQYPLAILHAKKGLDTEPTDPDLWYYLAESRRQLSSDFDGQAQAALLDAATQAFESGLKLFPMDDRLLVKAALAYAQRGDFRRSDQLFQTAFEWSPYLAQTYAYYGLRFQLEHRWPEAIAAYRRSKELQPNALAVAGLNESRAIQTQPVPARNP